MDVNREQIKHMQLQAHTSRRTFTHCEQISHVHVCVQTYIHRTILFNQFDLINSCMRVTAALMKDEKLVQSLLYGLHNSGPLNLAFIRGIRSLI